MREKTRIAVANIVFRFQWRAALVRLGVAPNAARIIAIVDRPDGQAMTLTVRSRTRQAADLLSNKGIERLGWALNSRVLALGVDPYNPTDHRVLIEAAPLVAGHLPERAPFRFGVTSRAVPIGLYATTGETLDIDFWSAERGSVSALVAGTTGSGKSNTVNVILSGLITAHFCVVGIDCKSGETLTPWSSVLGHPVVDPYVDLNACDELLARLVSLMEARQRCPLPNYCPIVLVVEEWASLPLKPTSIGDRLERLAAQGRSARIGILATTQRPTSNVGAVRTSTRGNLPIRIAHSTVGDRFASEAILGAGMNDAADLPTEPPGLALIRSAGSRLEPVQVFQCPGPPWSDRPLSFTLDYVEAMDRAAQRECAIAT
jgi:FtsK/SpoIIIE family